MARKALGFDVKNLVAADNTTTAISMKLHESNDLSGEGKIQAIMLEDILPNRYNPRKLPEQLSSIADDFITNDSKSLSERKELFDTLVLKYKAEKHKDIFDHIYSLAEHIAEHGMMSPILVTPITNDKYEVVAGERRYWASRLIGRKVIRAAIRHLNETQHRVLSISENLAREGLTLKEQVIALSELQSLDERYFKHPAVQRSFGISRSRAFALLKCTKEPYLSQVMSGKLTNVNNITDVEQTIKVHPVDSDEKITGNVTVKIPEDKLIEVARMLKIDVENETSTKDIKKRLEKFFTKM